MSLRAFVLACAMLVLAGCGSVHYQERAVLVGQYSEWRKAPGRTDQPVVVTKPRARDALLVADVGQYTVERQWTYEVYRIEGRRTREPDMVSLALGAATLGLGCAIDTEGCFGEYGEWEERQTQRRNERSTDNERRGPLEPLQRPLSFTVRVQGLDPRERPVGEVQRVIASTEGELRVPLAAMAQRLPKRPTTLLVEAKAPGVAEPLLASVPGHLVTDLQLDADQWLPPAEQLRVYRARLAPALRAGNHEAAQKIFERIEQVNPEPPAEIQFLHANTLVKLRRNAAARRKLEQYLARTGGNGEHAAEARRLLSGL
ncbi:hypothetical protein IS481_17265 [Caldimonas thermodepolymerans]|jgi:hypothetical protein|uniref:Tetratricopeptide repeat protein n=1 Tax=Caldimonas thermodepolymerans TaxID=215580 RepID=A0A2S5T8D4_9BURK|nr:hypothetical protein [Caldimonas thermodepolymerans]PPE71138.1 hypothetical protein C1702_04040 [Caldimonas thermodepolymerans]QPC31441.1 hypothetical protein IS481_17265 [Caldimonas thermodepolymerans]RDH99586.1 hypothetical protein DES46_10567 [Caldimonas thermodepolymerans]TCP07688.1 hypothetical protein EV676_104244 [Caldimonas thermodepolymerans]UZG44189.1 hypothetical protein ONZ46_17690 [Caldimonas thermodepolymerans]